MSDSTTPTDDTARQTNRTAVSTDNEYMTHWLDTRSAITHLDVTTIRPENTGNRFEFPHTESPAHED